MLLLAIVLVIVVAGLAGILLHGAGSAPPAPVIGNSSPAP
jgi:hypothetical protein